MMIEKILKYLFWCLFACVAFFISWVLGTIVSRLMPLWLFTLICVLLLAICFIKLAEMANDSEK